MGNVEIPRSRIERAFQQILETPATIRSVIGSMTKRLRAFVETQAAHFQHLR